MSSTHSAYWRITLTLAFCAVVFACNATRADESEWRPGRLWVSCSDQYIWVTAASNSKEGELPQIRMWVADQTKSKSDADALPSPKRSIHLPDINGDPVCVTADKEGLRLIYSNQATWSYYANSASTSGANWERRASMLPLAWGGDATRRVFWALVARSALADNRETPASGPAGNSQTAIEQPAGSKLALLERRNGRWSHKEVLDAANAGTGFWITGRDGVPHLFWSTPEGDVRTASLSDAGWTAPELVTHNENIRAAWAGVSLQGPVFIAGERHEEDEVLVSVYRRQPEGWKAFGKLKEGYDYVTLNPASGGVTIWKDMIGVGRVSPKGEIQFGWCDIAGNNPMRFGDLSQDEPAASPQTTWEQTLLIGLVFGLLSLVIFSRREQIHAAIALPLGFSPSPAWKRALAAALDAMPAMFVVIMFHATFSDQLGLPTDIENLSDILNDPESKRAALITQGVFIATHFLWCFIWELRTRTTLGKKLLGCRILSTNGRPLNAKQIILRNLLRSIAIAIGTPGLMMEFMLIVFLTRNRQRLGDLLAHTLVVEYDPNASPRRARPIDRDDMS